MLKIRLMGTKSDIRWFQNFLQIDSDIEVLELSDLYPNKGTDRYYRSYAEVERKESKKQMQINSNSRVGRKGIMCRTVVVERDIGSYRKAAVMNSGKLLQAKTVIEVYQKNVEIQQEGGRENE